MAKTVRKTAVKKAPARRVATKAAEALKADRTKIKVRSRPAVIEVSAMEEDFNSASEPVDLFSSFESRILAAFERNTEARKRLEHSIAPVLVSSSDCLTEGAAGECERSRLERLVDLVVDRINDSSYDLESMASRVRM